MPALVLLFFKSIIPEPSPLDNRKEYYAEKHKQTCSESFRLTTADSSGNERLK